jgi:hypothetical protein
MLGWIMEQNRENADAIMHRAKTVAQSSSSTPTTTVE